MTPTQRIAGEVEITPNIGKQPAARRGVTRSGSRLAMILRATVLGDLSGAALRVNASSAELQPKREHGGESISTASRRPYRDGVTRTKKFLPAKGFDFKPRNQINQTALLRCRMSISAHIQELRSSVGAQAAEILPPNETVAFSLRADGGLTITLASGEVLNTQSTDCVSAAIQFEHRAASAELLAALVKLVPGQMLRTGVTYVRRKIATADGKFSLIAVEAGR